MNNWRKTREYRIWRVEVIRKEGSCRICGSMKNRHAHHISHATYFPELRFDVDNGICLCQKCHMNLHCNFKNSYRTKCTKDDLQNFICLVNYIKEITTIQIADMIERSVNENNDS